MDVVIPLVFVGVLAAVVLVFLALTLVPAFRARQSRSLARAVGLELDPSIAARVERRLTLRARLGAVGALIGLAAGTALVLVGDLGFNAGAWLVNGGFFIGLGIGVSASSLVALDRPSEPTVRVARSRDITLSDYLAPHELIPTRILVVVAAALAPAVWLVPRDAVVLPALFPAAPLVALLAVGAAVVLEVGGRAVIARPAPAQTAEQLAWEDALRATALRQMLTAPLTLAGVSIIWSGFGALTLLPPSVGQIVLGITMPVLMTGLIVVAVLSIVSRPQRYFLRHLWPDLASPR